MNIQIYHNNNSDEQWWRKYEISKVITGSMTQLLGLLAECINDAQTGVFEL